MFLILFFLSFFLHFCDINAGVYKLIPYYKGENTVFDVSPPSVVVTVPHDHATISEKFQVHQRNIYLPSLLVPSLWISIVVFPIPNFASLSL